ncbi:Cysteine protease [Arachis hypogaea]|nr:Cysteine protease [Arachis hypogaea]
MAIYVVSGDEDGERGGAPVVCIEDASKRCSDFSRGKLVWTPLLLLVPLVLGLDKINPRYIPLLQSTFKFPQSLGILGGKPGASTYLIGVQGDKALYLDPHEVQQVVNINGESQETSTSSYHSNVIRHIPLDSINPSLAIGSYCRDKDDFDDFCSRASKLAEESNGALLITVAQSWRFLLQTASNNSPGGNLGFQDDDSVAMDVANEAGNNEDDWQLLTHAHVRPLLAGAPQLRRGPLPGVAHVRSILGISLCSSSLSLSPISLSLTVSTRSFVPPITLELAVPLNAGELSPSLSRCHGPAGARSVSPQPLSRSKPIRRCSFSRCLPFRALFKASSFEGALFRRRRAHIEEESSQAPPFPPPLGQAVIHFSAAPLSTSQSSYSPRSLSSATLSHATSSILGTNSSDGSRQEKYGMTNKPRGEPEDAQRSNKGERGVFRSIKVYPLESNDKRLNYEPPTDLLSKLSLVSKVKKPAKLPSKVQPIS